MISQRIQRLYTKIKHELSLPIDVHSDEWESHTNRLITYQYQLYKLQQKYNKWKKDYCKTNEAVTFVLSI
jgi:hypothetical protein